MSGWIKIHKKITDWEWFKDHNTFFLFMYLLVSANFKDKKWQGMDIKRGSFITSLPNLSEETGLTVKQVRGSLDKLVRTGEIIRKSTNRNTIITVKNYGMYQDDARLEGRQNFEETAGDTAYTGHSEGNQTAGTKEFKDLNNLNNLNNTRAHACDEACFVSFSDALKSKGIKI